MTTPRQSPQAGRLESLIRQYGRISARDLAAETGITSGNQEGRLVRAIAAGRVLKEVIKTKGVSGRGLIYWVWRGTGAPARERGPRDAAPRKCLGCGQEFASTHAGNRLCLRCGGDVARNASPFDVPATVRYR